MFRDRMKLATRFVVLLSCVCCLGWLGACTNVRSGPVQSSGTPVNPFTDPGGADEPSAPLTGAQPENR